MEEIKYGSSNPKTLKGVVYLNQEHTAPIFDGIELDESVILISSSKNKFQSIKKSFFEVPKAKTQLFVGQIKKSKIQAVKHILNTWCQDFLEQQDKNDKIEPCACLFSLRYLQDSSALLLMSDNKKTIDTGTIFDFSSDTNFLDTLQSHKTIVADNFVLFETGLSLPLTRLLPFAFGFLQTHKSQNLLNIIAKDNIARSVEKEKQMLLSHIEAAVPIKTKEQSFKL